MTTKHSLGPWQVILCNSGYEVTDIHNRSVYNRCNPDEQEANARLISAAPELLEALKGILCAHNLDMWKMTNGSADDVINKIKQIISKAEGK